MDKFTTTRYLRLPDKMAWVQAHYRVHWCNKLSHLPNFNAENHVTFLCYRAVRIIGCYLPWLWLKRGGSPLLLIPTAMALAMFVWLLTLHPEASGRVYAAYGGVYVCTALLWLRFVDGVKLSHFDWAGAAIALCGMLIIVAGWGRA